MFFVPCHAGTLPWRTDPANVKDDTRDAVLRSKQTCLADPSRYFRHTPVLPPLVALANYLAALGFSDAPDYGHMYGILSQLPDDAVLPPPLVAGDAMAAAAAGYGVAGQGAQVRCGASEGGMCSGWCSGDGVGW